MLHDMLDDIDLGVAALYGIVVIVALIYWVIRIVNRRNGGSDDKKGNGS